MSMKIFGLVSSIKPNYIMQRLDIKKKVHIHLSDKENVVIFEPTIQKVPDFCQYLHANCGISDIK
jgi:hypothetical protein